MNNMEISNIMHKMLPRKSKIPPINRGSRTFQERPGLGFIFRDIWVPVVEVGDGHDPVIHPQVWYRAEQHDSLRSYFRVYVPECCCHQADANVRGYDEAPLPGTEERARR